MRRKNKYGLCVVVLLAVIGTAGWNIGRELLEYRAGTRTYEEMAQIFRHETPQTGGKPAPEAEAPARDFAALQAVNPDIRAWVSVPGTNIDYPVVQAGDNNYYLRRLVTGQWNSAGSIFLDYRCSADFSDPYSIIYGHNMLNGTMFSSLMEYKTQAFYEQHPVGVLETPEAQYEIRFFAGFVADVDHPVWDPEVTAEEVPEWGAEMQKRSCFRSGLCPAEGDTVLTLATCSYEFNNARFVLLGILDETGGA